MTNFTPEIRVLLAGVFLSGYLMSAFQAPLMEGIHFFMHLEDLASNTFLPHKYYSGEDHSHQSLELVDAMLDNQNDELPPPVDQNNVQIKKSPEVSQLPAFPGAKSLLNTKIKDRFIMNYLDPSLEVLSPPPKA